MIIYNKANIDFGLEENDLVSIIKILKSLIKNSQIRIFGSRAKGNFRNGSDIDIAIIGEHLSLNKILDIRYELDELNLPYHFDIIDYNKIKNPDLKSHIDSVGIEI